MKFKKNTHKNENEQFTKIKNILDYIDKNFEKGITLEEISQAVHFSNSHLSRFFKEMMGITFQEYLDYIRLDKASELLLSTNKLITEVATKSGLANVKSLNRLFREHYNLTPSEFRDKYKDVIQDLENRIEENNKISNSYLDINRTNIYGDLFKYLNIKTLNDKENIESVDVSSNLIVVSTSIDTRLEPFSQYWKELTTLGRAAEGLRSDVQIQLRELQKDIGFKYIRFHGIFSDDMMICNLDKNGHMDYNWTYVNKLFDFFKEINIKPFVGLSFMPSELKSSEETIFWWNANTSQPKDINIWKNLVSEFVKHCINRYGLGEVETWYFEVWNEPELEGLFWIGDREDYFKFYNQTVSAIKSISKNLKVGGPAVTSQVLYQGNWMDDFLNYCIKNEVALDYVSIHIYPEKYVIDTCLNEQKEIDFNGQTKFEEIVRIKDSLKTVYLDKENTLDSLKELHKKINIHTNENVDIHVTEWNASSKHGNLIHDTCFMANYIIYNVLKCKGKTKSLGHWVFTDIMEEIRAVKKEFHGGFGLMTGNGLKKPSYFAYYMLNKLGDEIIDQGDEYIITKKDEDIQILLYNYAYFDNLFLSGDTSALQYKQRYMVFEEKEVNEVNINIGDIKGKYKVTRYKLDRDNGSVYDNWIKMGSPEDMDKEEIEYLKDISQPRRTVEYLDLYGSYKAKIYNQVHGVDLIILEKKIT